MILYGYWRSSAAYRVRLALGYKGLSWESIPIDLRHDVQSDAEFLGVNPQGLVPVLVTDVAALSQSLAIIEYLEETASGPALLPADPIGRARVRAAAQVIACDIHPINNLRVQRYLTTPLGHDQAEIDAWSRHWINRGLAVLEQFAVAHGEQFLHGNAVSMADICLIPQLYNARRAETDLAAFPRLLAIDSRLARYEFAVAAHPDAQPDRT